MNARLARDIVSEQWYGGHADLLRGCESPIEKLLVACLCRRGYGDRLALQLEVDRFRLDVVVDGWLVVECDGWQWHYEREEQVAADLRRTRFLMAKGLSVVRFTGKEIWGDVERCADELEAILSGDDRRRAA